MTLYIYPYKIGSTSAKALAGELNCKRIKHYGSRYRPKETDLIINWGSSSLPTRLQYSYFLNIPEDVAVASHKLDCLTRLANENIPTIEWTTDKQKALEWVTQDHKVYARQTLTGHSGAGIVIITTPEQLNNTNAPLYTKEYKTKREYRVHAHSYGIIHIQQKRLRQDAPEDRTRGIRNLANGWVFACNNVDPLPDEAQQVAIRGIQEIGLHFGAVDLLVDRYGKAVICEINTAPGLSGTTLQKYKEFFNEHYTRFIDQRPT
jgi:hypothetical protein